MTRQTEPEGAASIARPVRDRLLDDLRFGPMAHYMMGWSEEQRTMLVTDLADDLLRSGYTLAEPCNGAHNMSTEVENGEI